MPFVEFLLIWLLIWGLAAVFVAGDASQKGRSSGFWFMAVFFLGIFGIFAYVVSVGVSGDDKNVETFGSHDDVHDASSIGTKICPNCSEKNPREANYCGDCGYEFGQTKATS